MACGRESGEGGDACAAPLCRGRAEASRQHRRPRQVGEGEHTQIDKRSTRLPPLPFTTQLRAVKASSAEALRVQLLITQHCPRSCDRHNNHY